MSTTILEDYKGYRGVALNTLQKFKTPIWSDVEILTDEGSFKGLILPRYPLSPLCIFQSVNPKKKVLHFYQIKMLLKLFLTTSTLFYVLLQRSF